MSISISEEPKTFQANCDRCGWHTRPYTNKPTVERFAETHEAVCPNPEPPRQGALMSCGCWNYAPGGAAAGEFTERCPRHGDSTAVRMNVDEPEGEKAGHLWTHRVDSEEE